MAQSMLAKSYLSELRHKLQVIAKRAESLADDDDTEKLIGMLKDASKLAKKVKALEVSERYDKYVDGPIKL